MTAIITSRYPAAVLAGVAVSVGGEADLRTVLEAAGLVAPPVRTAQRRVGPRNLCLLSPVSSPGQPAEAPYGPCPLPLCHNPAPSPGVPCRGCVAALGPYLREVPGAGGIGEAA